MLSGALHSPVSFVQKCPFVLAFAYDATKFKRGILAIRRAIHCARNNPVAKTLRFTRRRRRRTSWLPVDTEFIFHAPLSVVSMFHRLPLILEFRWPRLFRAYGQATCFTILFLDVGIHGNSLSLSLSLSLSIYLSIYLYVSRSLRNVKFQRAS